MKQETSNKIFRYCYAGCWGILGFVGAYWLMGVLLAPIEHYIVNKYE